MRHRSPRPFVIVKSAQDNPPSAAEDTGRKPGTEKPLAHKVLEFFVGERQSITRSSMKIIFDITPIKPCRLHPYEIPKLAAVAGDHDREMQITFHGGPYS
jgi:hypothetical protein